jgi:hypothetical protein
LSCQLFRRKCGVTYGKKDLGYRYNKFIPYSIVLCT